MYPVPPVMKTRRGLAHSGNFLTFKSRRISEIEAGTCWVRSRERFQMGNQFRSLTRNTANVIQTGRDECPENWPGTGDRSLEPGCANREFGHWQRNIRAAGYGGGTSREAECGGGADCRGGDRHYHGLLCGSRIAVF